MSSNEDKFKFLKEELKIRAVILFCESQFLNFLNDKIDYTKVDMNLQTSQMRKLDEKDGDSYRLIASDDAELLSRGLDFRGRQNGLTFVQAKTAPTKRAFHPTRLQGGKNE